ncbi:MAG: TRAP transporter small permease [Hydrogenophaga sp.]|jgi:TRAP-type C4-dicarboxylate transport system permease small subunit|uniref:TRAP transporter small permease n=1 Tax=Hydrogenophaga sp. TaxID=1904254 RepID=UPI00262E2608|nr:TRAP transporter small permease [Hydrogenophaga sp.]MCV0439375.1 TRAP transporter small permease [Hydrogenophaga sp.]
MAETIHRALDAVYLACIWVAGTCVFLMSLIIPWGIFTRYVLGTGSQWPEPISILLMVVFTFLGAAASYRAGAHIAVVMLTERLPTAARGMLAFAVNILMLLVSVFMVFYGTRLCMGTWGQSIPELPWLPVGLTYVPVPLGGFITLLFVLEFLLGGDQSQRRVVRYDLLDDAQEGAA